MTPECKSCRFFNRAWPPECRRHSPGVPPVQQEPEGHLNTNDRRRWPTVYEYEWCGDFDATEEAANPHLIQKGRV